MTRFLLVASLAFACACASQHPQRNPHDITLPPNALVDMARVGRDFTWRQSITATYKRTDQGNREASASFEAVVQKQGDTLTIVGLMAFGARAFAAHQKGVGIELDQAPSTQLPFPPQFIFLDINRCFFMGVETFVPKPDGVHEQVAYGERFVDEWRGGLLVARTLKGQGTEKADVKILYRPGLGPHGAPASLELRNERFGYALAIETLEAEGP